MARLLAVAALVTAQEVRLSFKAPRNGTRVLALVEPVVDLWVVDSKAFVAEH